MRRDEEQAKRVNVEVNKTERVPGTIQKVILCTGVQMRAVGLLSISNSTAILVCRFITFCCHRGQNKGSFTFHIDSGILNLKFSINVLLTFGIYHSH